MEKHSIHLIACIDCRDGLGKANEIPWNIPLERTYFADVTKRRPYANHKNVMIVGRNTWRSLPPYCRGFVGRITVVVSTTMSEEILKSEQCNAEEDVHVAHSLDDVAAVLHLLRENGTQIGDIFVCGGARLYKEAIDRQLVRDVYLNELYMSEHDCDVFFPREALQNYLQRYQSMYVNHAHILDLVEHVPTPLLVSQHLYQPAFRNKEEARYLSILAKLLFHGEKRVTRSGTTYSCFDEQLRFDLSRGYFPLYTTKRVAFRAIVEELLFFLAGTTDTKMLEAANVNIWRDNTSSAFLTSHGLPYAEGDMGPMYGFVLRHAGAGTTYAGAHADYTGVGFDQIAYCLHLLKHDPTSRRILMTTYEPASADRGVLYPCHGIAIQFFVSAHSELSCKVTIRSNDWCCGNPFNVASYALLVHCFVYAVNHDPTYAGTPLTPGHLTLDIGDVHLYANHAENALRQILRVPYRFPTLHIKPRTTDAIGVFPSADDFVLENYMCHSFLPYVMNP